MTNDSERPVDAERLSAAASAFMDSVRASTARFLTSVEQSAGDLPAYDEVEPLPSTPRRDAVQAALRRVVLDPELIQRLETANRSAHDDLDRLLHDDRGCERTLVTVSAAVLRRLRDRLKTAMPEDLER